jgi:DNA primase
MAGLISPATLEQIRAASDIVDVIGGYLRLRRAGANFVTLCPFHKEKTPSFSVNPHRQIFHCFGCQKGGDVFRFVQEYESITFVEAVRRLAQRAGIPLEFDNEPGQHEARHLKETLLQMHEQICQRWQVALTNEAAGQIARDYLAKRGVSEEAVKLFRLGYAPDAWDDTVNWARSKGYEPALVEQGGLIIRKEDTGRHYDRFRGRLMFPICDEQGRVIGFSGRILTGDEKTAKYVNSPETPIFTKGKVFFGLDKSKRAILDAGFAIICEGQLDLIACYMSGTRNIVAPQGTAFTGEHARILKRYVDEVVLCFDSDTAGQSAAVRVLDSLLASGLAIRVATVPAPHDPDSFIKEQGGEAFAQLIAKAEGFFDYYLGRLTATNDVSTDKGRLAVLSGMAEAVLKTGNAVLADTYAQKTALRLGVSPEAVRKEFAKHAGRNVSEQRVDEESQDESQHRVRRLTRQEFELLKLVLQCDDQVEWFAQNFDAGWLQNSVVRTLIERCFALHSDKTWTDIPSFLSQFDDPAVQSLITEVLSRPLVQHEDGTRFQPRLDIRKPREQLIGMIAFFRKTFVDRGIADLQKRLAQPNLPPDEMARIYRQKEELKRLKEQALPELSAGPEAG